MVIDLNDTYIMMTMMMMIKTKNGHNLAHFQASTSIFCIVVDLNDGNGDNYKDNDDNDNGRG